jgi:prolyl-tRNA synthetase
MKAYRWRGIEVPHILNFGTILNNVYKVDINADNS